MCGIVGFSGKDGGQFDPNKIKLLMLYNQSRGEDSSGFWTPSTGIVKTMGKTSEKMLPEYEFAPDKVFIGHTRKASWGGTKTVENAHPFDFDEFVYVHNGTLTDVFQTSKNLDVEYSKITVDSLLIGYAFKKHKTVKEAMGELSGVANIIMGYKNNDNITVYKHKERELFRGKCEEGMYISSIKDSLKAIGCTSIKEFSDGYWYNILGGEVVNHSVVKMREIISVTNNYSNNTPSSSAYNDYWKWEKGIWVKSIRTFDSFNSKNQKITIHKDTYYYVTKGLETSVSKRISISFDGGSEEVDRDNFELIKPCKFGKVATVLGEKSGYLSAMRKVLVLSLNNSTYTTAPSFYRVNEKVKVIDVENFDEIQDVDDFRSKPDVIELVNATSLVELDDYEYTSYKISKNDIEPIMSYYKEFTNNVTFKFKKGDLVKHCSYKTSSIFVVENFKVVAGEARYDLYDEANKLSITSIPERLLTAYVKETNSFDFTI